MNEVQPFPIRVTFDSNTLVRAVWPNRFPKDSRNDEYVKINKALVDREIDGFFCETLVLIEGVQKKDRANVLASTTLRTEIQPKIINPNGIVVTPISIKAMQQRPPLHPEMSALIQSAMGLNFRVLGAPRVAQTRIADPDGSVYVQESPNNLGERLDRYHDSVTAIEAKGLGAWQVQNLAKKFAERAGVIEPWYNSLIRAKDIHEENAIKRACAEWADGEFYLCTYWI